MILTAKQKQDEIKEKIKSLKNQEWSEEDKKKIDVFTNIMERMPNEVLLAIYEAQIIMNGAETKLDRWVAEQSLTMIQRINVEETLVWALASKRKCSMDFITSAYVTICLMSQEGHQKLKEIYFKRTV
jgi:hypothetical protein